MLRLTQCCITLFFGGVLPDLHMPLHTLLVYLYISVSFASNLQKEKFVFRPGEGGGINKTVKQANNLCFFLFVCFCQGVLV